MKYFNRFITSKELVCQLGFFSFYVTMALGRFSCDFLRQRFGRDRIAKSSGIFVVVGFLAVILSPSLSSPSEDFAIAVATMGFAVVGCGISTLIPTMFSTAGHLSNRHSGTAIAVVAGFTYSGSIVSHIQLQ
jgi:MFS family permease